MSPLERIRIVRPEPVPAPRPVPMMALAAGSELGDDDLEQVVGGLDRVYVPHPAAY